MLWEDALPQIQRIFSFTSCISSGAYLAPNREGPPPSRSAPSLDDFLKDWVVYYGDDGVTPSFGQTTPPPSTLEPSSTSEPSTTPNPLKFYIDQLKKKSDLNQEKKLRFTTCIL